MQSRGSITTTVAGIVGIILILLVVGAAIYFIIRSVSGASEPEPEPAESPIISQGADRSVRLSVRGPIVARENHHEYQIIVGPDSREMSVFQGYTNDRIRVVTLGNSDEAYEQFVYALQEIGIDSAGDEQIVETDLNGICPNGRLYRISALDSNREVASWWRSSCGSEGNLNIRSGAVAGFFHEQIPQYRELLEGIDL